ncbi:MAG TPA: hemerythrin domain-containing protein [Stellaceae bacterium]|nr:hemerythrin domain-containing protein [Stellaceae bacterium]
MTILDTLRRDHANMLQVLRTLERQLAEFRVGKQPDYDVLLAAVDYLLTFPGLSHHPTEDLIFDKLRQRAPEIAASVGNLRTAHDALAVQTRVLVDGLRAVLAEAELPREAIVRWSSELIDHQRQHIEMEERTFFPAAAKTFTKKDWSELRVTITKSIDPLFEAKVDEKFAELRKAIFAWQRQDEAVASARS